ncbi:hypothetical protein GCM10009609_40380 [Pseudonocardia aurantiaca]|uniref:DUF4333 domain-containing protein n=1 Tax=Pseudonocardia aurantiaca TaxID=75290 RepID=A0ABW4FPA1_9PSEU
MNQPAYSVPDAYADFTPPPPPRRSAGKIATAVGGAIVALAGLGVGVWYLLAPATLDTAKVEAEIVRATVALGLTPTGVRCPGSIPVATDRVDTCSATLEGQQVTYTVKQKDDEGNVNINSSGFVVVSQVEALLREQVGSQAGVEVVAECAGGSRVVVGGPGTTVDCTVADAANPSDYAEFTGTVKDDQGTVDFG